MPDIYGKYTLLEMIHRTWRRLGAYYPESVDINSGEESQVFCVDPLFSRDDVIDAINEAASARFTDLIVNSQSVLLDEDLIHVNADQAEYRIPEDAAIIRALYWKDPSNPLELVPPNERVPMVNTDNIDTNIYQPGDTFGCIVPTWKRRLDYIVIDPVPTIANRGGILIEYVKWLNYLANDDDVLETQFARALQECCILQAVITLGSRKGKMRMEEENAQLLQWDQRFALLVRNAVQPAQIQMTHNGYEAFYED